MKKFLLILAILVSTASAFASDKIVDPKVLESFNSEFSAAKEVNWSRGENFFKAEFLFNGQHVSAFYNPDGELLGLTRYISSTDLPLNLQTALKKTYSDFWISDLFEVTKSDSTGYYITLENADTMIILKASIENDWSVYKKVKKA
jgi:hypothetical protein